MFDRDKVAFTEADLNAAEALDEIYETLKGEDGFNLLVLAGQITKIQLIAEYLMDGDRNDLADRLMGLGFMFVRDNVDLSVSDTD